MLQVPKSAVNVEFAVGQGNVERGLMFVSESASGHQPNERLQTVLATRRFLPVKLAGGVCFMRCAGVMWVRLDILDAIDELSPETEGAENSRAADVEILLVNGSKLAGAVRYLLPPEARRLGDYLDTMPQFFPLRTPDHVYLVNRECCLRVQPVPGNGA